MLINYKFYYSIGHFTNCCCKVLRLLTINCICNSQSETLTFPSRIVAIWAGSPAVTVGLSYELSDARWRLNFKWLIPRWQKLWLKPHNGSSMLGNSILGYISWTRPVELSWVFPQIPIPGPKRLYDYMADIGADEYTWPHRDRWRDRPICVLKYFN